MSISHYCHVQQDIFVTSTDTVERGSRSCPRHALTFELPVSPSAVANERYPDKTKLKETILALRDLGWSYREIGREVGLHWTRVGQIVRNMARD